MAAMRSLVIALGIVLMLAATAGTPGRRSPTAPSPGPS